MDFVRLNEEQRQSFDDDGFLVLRNVLDQESIARLIDAGDQRARKFLDKPDVHDRSEYNQLDLRPGLIAETDFRALVAHSSTVPLIVQLLGPNIHLHSVALIYKRPETQRRHRLDADGTATFAFPETWGMKACRASV